MFAYFILYLGCAGYLFGLRPEELRIGGRVALPVVVDESYWNQPYILLCRIGAIVALRVESAIFLADKVVEVLRDIVIQIVLLGLLVLVIPIGRLAEHQRQVVGVNGLHLVASLFGFFSHDIKHLRNQSIFRGLPFIISMFIVSYFSLPYSRATLAYP